MKWPMVMLLAAAPVLAQEIAIEGTVCRMNRSVDRMIIGTDDGPRIRVAVGRNAPLHYEGQAYDRSDLRPGDRVRLFAVRDDKGLLRARNIFIKIRVDDALLDSFLGSHRATVGRFTVREAKTEFFMLRMPGPKYLRVDGKAAYGPKGRVYVKNLKPGDLLEIRGSWPSKELLQASSINVITDREPSFCRTRAHRGEMQTETNLREAGERRFLDGANE